MTKGFIFQIIIVAVAGLLQNLPWLNFAGIRPNWALIVLLIFSFMTSDILEYLVLLLVALVFLQTGALPPLVYFALVAIAAFYIRQLLPWQTLLNYLLLVALGSTGFYLLLDRQFILADTQLFFLELLYNLIIGGVLFLLLAQGYEKRTRIKL